MIERLTDRLTESLTRDLSYCSMMALEHVSPFCESPIEVLLGASILLNVGLTDYLSSEPFLKLNPSGAPISGARFALTPQYSWQGFRIDWCIRASATGRLLFVECDGHDFHERTKEQAERDRSRDRIVTLAGIPLLRFTGREIYRDVGLCVRDIVAALPALEVAL